MKLDLRKLYSFKRIDINEDINFNNIDYQKMNITKINDMHATGYAKVNYEDNIELELDVNGSLVMPCAITLEDVINGNYSDTDIEELNTSKRYATVMCLSQVDEENLEKVRGFVTYLGNEFVAIFDALWVHGEEDRLERLAEIRLEKKLIK